MKIAVATTDGLVLAKSFEQVRTLLIITIESGRTAKEELRALDMQSGKDFTFIDVISDCEAVIVNEICEECHDYIINNGIDCITTKETFVTNVVIDYVANQVREMSNTCCCP